jgi:uncharacterized membrane protein YfhO
MTDEVTYVTPDNKKHNIWTEPPVYLPPGTASLEAYNALKDKSVQGIRLLGPESVDGQMIFKTKVEVGNDCSECIVVFKQTAHPNWKAYIDGKPAKTVIVFPFFTGVSVPAGTHEIELSYKPSKMKQILLVFALMSTVCAFLITRLYHQSEKR